MVGHITILPETTRDPISKIGRRAGVCWGADTTDDVRNYKRGIDCIKADHGRTFEYVNVELIIDGYSARVIREWYTHIGGAPTRLQASTRYMNYEDFGYIVPIAIEADERALKRYQCVMAEISNGIKALTELGVSREDVANLLPLGMTTRIVDKRNLRSLIDMSRQRMCNRAYHEFRGLFNDILVALSLYSDEWATVIDMTMHPKCDELQKCKERYGCGRWPSDDDQ